MRGTPPCTEVRDTRTRSRSSRWTTTSTTPPSRTDVHPSTRRAHAPGPRGWALVIERSKRPCSLEAPTCKTTGTHRPRTFRPQEQTDRILLCAIAHELHMHGLYSTASSRAVRRPYTQGSPRGANVSSRFRKRRFADSFTRSHNSISSGHSSSSESSVVDVVGDVLDVLEPVPASTPSAPSPRVSNSCGHS